MNRPGVSEARVPTCSARVTGCHKRQQEERADRPVPPLGQQPAQHRRVLVVGAPGRVVLAQEQGLQPGVSRGPDPLDHPLRAGAHVGHAVTTAFGDPDVH